jgi:hypothetical protein
MRVAKIAAFGAITGGLSAFSHAVAGGMLGGVHLLVITAFSALAFAALQRWMNRPIVLVAALLSLQLVAHVWLEAVHPHQHGGASLGGHAHGVAGAIEHALTPGMLMMWSHFAAVIAAVLVYVVARPLVGLLSFCFTSAPQVASTPVAAPIQPALPEAWLPVVQQHFLTPVISRRGPPVCV